MQASEKAYRLLPVEHQKLIPNYVSHLNQIRTCIEHNYEIIKLIIADSDQLFENERYAEEVNLYLFRLPFLLSQRCPSYARLFTDKIN